MTLNSSASNHVCHRHPAAVGQPVSALGWTMAVVAGSLIWWLLIGLAG